MTPLTPIAALVARLRQQTEPRFCQPQPLKDLFAEAAAALLALEKDARRYRAWDSGIVVVGSCDPDEGSFGARLSTANGFKPESWHIAATRGEAIDAALAASEKEET
jgi:hypothetical protein